MILPKPHGPDYHQEHLMHDEFYDAYYCQKCDFWMEDRCIDPHCIFCPTRPEKPSKVFVN